MPLGGRAGLEHAAAPTSGDALEDVLSRFLKVKMDCIVGLVDGLVRRKHPYGTANSIHGQLILKVDSSSSPVRAVTLRSADQAGQWHEYCFL